MQPLFSNQNNLFSSPIQRPTTWNDLMLKPELLHAVSQLEYRFPSPIQVMAIPKILQDKNLICQAKAGTGKTAVFLLGILNNMRVEMNGDYQPHQCMIVVNTRELAYQTYQYCQLLSSCMTYPSVRIGCYIGGTSI